LAPVGEVASHYTPFGSRATAVGSSALAPVAPLVYRFLMTTPRTPLNVMPVLALICAYGCGEPNEEDPAGGDTSVTPTAVSPAPFPNTTAVSPAGAVSPVSGAACPARDEAGVTMLKANEVHNYGFT